MTPSPKDLSTLRDAHDSSDVSEARAFQLRVVHSPDQARAGFEIALEPQRDVIELGRDPGVGGHGFDDPRMSRLHARITWDLGADGFRFGDANSANGCRHNGLKSRSGLLHENDVLRLGDTLFVFERAADAMSALEETISRIAPSTLSVLVTGESGTGKELVAKRIHELSGCKGEFVAVNCAALNRELVTSELFGHTRGAFSNATSARGGLFLTAQDGTLLLDEIGDLPLDQQPALLRVLQERKVRPVGSDREIAASARIVAATHVDLAALAEQGTFRSDLLARIAQCVLRVPPLRERRSQVLELARTFAARINRKLVIHADAAERLVLWRWPFNVRELEGLIQTFCVLSGDTPLDLRYLRERHPALLAESETEAPQKPEDARRAKLERLMLENGGNVSAVARILGKPRAQIYRWLRRYGLMRAPSPDGKS